MEGVKENKELKWEWTLKSEKRNSEYQTNKRKDDERSGGVSK
jgi:hypothetical protein